MDGATSGQVKYPIIGQDGVRVRHTHGTADEIHQVGGSPPAACAIPYSEIRKMTTGTGY